MMREISEAITALCRTIVKATVTVEHSIDLADREVKLLEQRQDLRMAEAQHELKQRVEQFRLELDRL